MAFTFRVTPEELQKKSGEYTSLANEIRTHLMDILEASQRTRGYWQGEAGDRDREGYESYRDDIEYIMKRLLEHPDDLLKMAGLYEQAEKAAVQTGNALKTDLIV